ncbi:hypothetical protein [Spirilliplanes yamanashiensis]|uniref:Secreted protein n=1 Tax=Spirilliplanes yamanashiensis TaxID=42233 RepID=A0A8J3Y6B5_9ACTN|nr:hypothetical protein [Spirilliplanes yamanashiensis]MDP9814661.1 hypothetical protein [Spirilliplanes yamanashiensis]GIJ02314.1 hypothetical protein Sya03_16660 [Spirilliplanes yamanashiensis]
MRILTTFATAAAAIAAAGAIAATGAAAANAADADQPGGLVEDFSYPNADEILAQHNVKLKSGDGNILFVDCAVPGDVIKVESYDHTGEICFQLRGTHGYLSLEIARAVFVYSENKPVEATVVLAGETEPEAPVEVAPNEWTPIGEAANLPSATLLEIRA